MKGLILKDIYSVRLQMVGGVALLLLPNLLMFIAGNNIPLDDFNGLVGAIIYGVMNYITITLSSSFLLNTLELDEKSGWAKMQRTMPVTDGQIIMAKLLAMGEVLGILTGLSLFFNIFGTILFKVNAESLIALPIAMSLMQTIIMSVCFVFGYRFGSKITIIVYIGVELVVLAGAIMILVGFINKNISTAALRGIAYGGLPALTAAVIAVCHNAGKKAVTRDI